MYYYFKSKIFSDFFKLKGKKSNMTVNIRNIIIYLLNKYQYIYKR